MLVLSFKLAFIGLIWLVITFLITALITLFDLINSTDYLYKARKIVVSCFVVALLIILVSICISGYYSLNLSF